MFQRDLNMPMNTAAKICIHLHSSTYSLFPFHSTKVVFSVYFFKHEDTFFNEAITHFKGTTIVKSIDCDFFANTLNKISVLMVMLSKYVETLIIRGVFRTQLNIRDGAICKNG